MMVVRPLLAAVVCSTVAFAQQAPSQGAEGHGKVIFSRSLDDSQPNPRPAAQSPDSPQGTLKVTDAERSAVTFTKYDFDLHLMLKTQSLASRVQITVRNDGAAPLERLPLQLSSTLHFETVTSEGKRLDFQQQIVNSDADHTGQLREAVVKLPQPLAPKALMSLDVVYSGEIPLSTKRLEQIGTPVDLAQQSDWDRISDEFTGLRGFGDVVWYPVASVPQVLGDGAKLFTEIGRQKLRQQDAQVGMHVTVEYAGVAPNVGVVDGRLLLMNPPSVMPSASFPGVVTYTVAPHRLGFGAVSLFLATRVSHGAKGLMILAADYDEPNVQGYLTAATMVQPLVEQWLGSQPREMLTLFDLPDRQDAAFEQGAATITGLQALNPDLLAGAMSHSLTHAYFQSPHEWLNEGVANFIGTLWIEQTKGREAALERLEATRGAMALVEPASLGEGAGQPLMEASDAVYYRSKATYVLWMLRDLAGDKALSAALRAYDPAQDTSPEYFEQLLEKASGKDLKWFFDDWVYHDKGLPDLSITATFPSRSAQEGQYLLSVDLANDGYAAAEVPLTVHSQAGTQTARVMIPARSKVTHRMLVQGLPTEVLLNDGVVPEVQASVHQRDITIAGATK